MRRPYQTRALTRNAKLIDSMVSPFITRTIGFLVISFVFSFFLIELEDLLKAIDLLNLVVCCHFYRSILFEDLRSKFET